MLPLTLRDRVLQIAGEHEGPFYLYDRETIRRTCSNFAALDWPEKSVHFATMANVCPEVLETIHEAGLGAFVNSLDHLRLALSLGFRSEEIVYTASGMNSRTMRNVRECGVVVNLDSVEQVATWQRAFPGVPTGIRCNVGERVAPRATRAGYFLGRESRLGLTITEIESLSGATFIDGLHLYVGTDLLDLEHFRECYEALAELAPRFPSLRYLDFGGGFGTPHEGQRFNFGAYEKIVTDVMSDVSRKLGRTVRLILEPGRLVVAEAGVFVCRVVDVKRRGERRLLTVDASSAQFPRPLFYPEEAFHPVSLLASDGATRESAPLLPSDVCGCSTYSRDYLVRGAALPEARIGDLVVLEQAGAYCASARTDFLGFPAATTFIE